MSMTYASNGQSVELWRPCGKPPCLGGHNLNALEGSGVVVRYGVDFVQ